MSQTESIRRLPYLPALDGLRGVAVLGVLAFHGGVSLAGGGFLGVSTFFTLSGFLITLLLLNEQGSCGRIALGAFWGRRFRRLLPAALVTVTLAAYLVWQLGDAATLRSFRGDGLAAVGYVANWHFVAVGESYARLFAAPSPLLHFWSLAIEEQFYLVFPLFATALLRVTKGSRRWFGLVISALFIASAAIPIIRQWSDDRIYFGTDARAAELLAGSLLAVLLITLTSRPASTKSQPATVRRRLSLDRLDLAFDRRALIALAIGGAVALGLMVVLWIATSQSTRWVYRGGLPLYAALSCFVIFSAILRGTPVARLLAVRPLRDLGKISYGVYLYHWPIMWWFTAARTGLDTLPRLVLTVSLTIALATVSFVFIEQPIRTGIRPIFLPRFGTPSDRRAAVARRPSFAVGAPAAATIVAGLVLAVTLSAPAPTVDIADAAAGTLITSGSSGPMNPTDLSAVAALPDEQASSTTTTAVRASNPAELATTTSAAPAPTTTNPLLAGAGVASPRAPGSPLTPKSVRRPSRPLRVLVLGDSIALYLNPAIDLWGQRTGIWASFGYARIGCGIGRGGERVNHDTPEPIPPDCGHWATELPKTLAEIRPDIVLIGSGLWDSTDRLLPGDSTWRAPGDPVYDQYLRAEFAAAADLAASTGAMVAWIDNPPLKMGVKELSGRTDYAVNQAERMVATNRAIEAVAAGRRWMRVIHYTTFLEAWPGGVFDLTLRPDGIHIDEAGRRPIGDWMGPEILDAYWSVKSPSAPGR